MAPQLGKTLLIANPVAQNGKGALAIDKVAGTLRGRLGADAFEVAPTAHPRHAVELARDAEGFQSIIALGGDGIIHEVANGLMERPVDDRPTLGVIPAGSGNDYARTLGMSEKLDEACAQLLEAQPHAVDVGCANGEWFVETLSFGLDAAIALDTVDRRARTGHTGTLLYMESGVDQLLHHLDTYRYRASFDGAAPVEGESITFAVQLGPYYGGGFKICPDAHLDSGSFDLCIAHPPVGIARALFIFLRAKDGKHTRFKQMELMQARTIHLEFDEHPPIQADGEGLDGTVFDIAVHPGALRVMLPPGSAACAS